jgi:hypothetical protein
MWATHRGLSKPCANRASCLSPSGTGGLRWCRHLQPEQIGQQDHTIAVRTRAAESHRARKQVACGATPLAERLLAALVLSMRFTELPVESQLGLELKYLGDNVQQPLKRICGWPNRTLAPLCIGVSCVCLCADTELLAMEAKHLIKLRRG